MQSKIPKISHKKNRRLGVARSTGVIKVVTDRGSSRDAVSSSTSWSHYSYSTYLNLPRAAARHATKNIAKSEPTNTLRSMLARALSVWNFPWARYCISHLERWNLDLRNGPGRTERWRSPQQYGSINQPGWKGMIETICSYTRVINPCFPLQSIASLHRVCQGVLSAPAELYRCVRAPWKQELTHL